MSTEQIQAMLDGHHESNSHLVSSDCLYNSVSMTTNENRPLSTRQQQGKGERCRNM